jgi:hypothetical protein
MDISQQTLDRLEDQIAWYEKKSASNQTWYKVCRGIVLVSAALIPLSANIEFIEFLPAWLGVLIVVVEGFQQLNQYHQNWTTYRSTCEALKHEKYLWIGKAGPYASSDNPNAMLAERIEALISQEHAKWVSTRQEATKKSSSGSTE